MEILTTVLVFLFLLSLAGLFRYYKAYSDQKGKNKALQEDINRITEEQEKIKHKYAREIADIEAKHTLDIEKRKYQYVAKFEIYKKFFALMDDFSKKSNDSVPKEFLLNCTPEFGQLN